jgi:chromosome segregation ATPase
MAAATDPDLRESLRSGRLSREHAITGFDVFAGARPSLRVVKSAGAPPTAPAADRELTRRRAEAQLRLETARAELAKTEARVRELEKTATEEARNAAEAREREAAARRAAAQAHADLKQVQAKVQAAERAAREP